MQTQNVDDKIFQEKNNPALTEKNLLQHSDGQVEKFFVNTEGYFLHSTGIENDKYNHDVSKCQFKFLYFAIVINSCLTF